METVEIITKILAGLTILAQILSLALVVVLITNKAKQLVSTYKISHNQFILSAYTVSMIATLGSLYFSDVAGYNPCKLCWYQRIFMYPQPILYLVALVNQDKKIRDYSLVLSVLGALLAGYHYLLQIGVITTTACSTVGFSVSCSENFGTTFGYVTIPMMAFAAFGLNALIWAVHRQVFKK